MRKPILAILAILLSAAFLTSPLAQPSAPGLPPIVGDPAFDPASLSGEMKIWYDRMLESLAASRSTMDQRSSSGDLFVLGRHVSEYTAALLMALRATGDLQFLDRAAELWENARADLNDAWCDGTTDGYLNWLWLAGSGSDYCKDTHNMDEAMTHGAVAMIAFALDQNRHLDPTYGAKADFWLSYLEDHFLEKWYSRAGNPVDAWETSRGFYKRLTHPRSNQLRTAYYLHRMTSNPFYLQRANVIENDLSTHVEINPNVPTAYQWKHQVSGKDEGYQRINYAHYFMNVILEMYLEQFGSYASDATMTKYMSTFRDVVFAKFGRPWSDMAYRVDGSGSTSTKVYGLSGLGRWDSTHYILDVAETRYSAGSAGVESAGGALMALSARSSGGGGPPPPAPSNLRRVDVK